MDIWSLVLLIIRTIHAVAAAIWVGGGIVLLVAIMPALLKAEGGGPARLAAGMAARFGRVAGGAIGVFVITGGILAFERLAQPGVTPAYGVVLGIKVALSFLAFGLVWQKGAWLEGWESKPITSLIKSVRTSRSGMAVIIGLVIYFISILAQYLFERSIING